MDLSLFRTEESPELNSWRSFDKLEMIVFQTTGTGSRSRNASAPCSRARV
jgi:hypothetical protein